ncbi:MAG: hypothetical protein AB7G93_01440 [Bdellovibrionales bacterium]
MKIRRSSALIAAVSLVASLIQANALADEPGPAPKVVRERARPPYAPQPKVKTPRYEEYAGPYSGAEAGDSLHTREIYERETINDEQITTYYPGVPGIPGAPAILPHPAPNMHLYGTCRIVAIRPGVFGIFVLEYQTWVPQYFPQGPALLAAMARFCHSFH